MRFTSLGFWDGSEYRKAAVIADVHKAARAFDALRDVFQADAVAAGGLGRPVVPDDELVKRRMLRARDRYLRGV
jgi:hypothetical protein